MSSFTIGGFSTEGSSLNPTIIKGTITQTTVQLSWNTGIAPSTLEQSNDNGVTWAPAVNTGLTVTGTTVTGLTAGATYKFRATFIPNSTLTTSTYTTDAQREIWVVPSGGGAITQNANLKKLDGTDVMATIVYSDTDGDVTTNLKGFPGFWAPISSEQGNTAQGNGHYQRIDDTKNTLLIEITFDKDIKLSHYLAHPRELSTTTTDRMKDMGFLLFDSANNQIGVINRPLTQRAWTESGLDVENVRKIQFIIFPVPNSGDAYEQFNYINLRIQ